MTNEQLENLKRLTLAIADALEGFSDCGAERHFPREKLDEVRRAWAALCELDPPAEPETSKPSFFGDREVARMTTPWASPIVRELAREVQAWRAAFDESIGEPALFRRLKSLLIDGGNSAAAGFMLACADIRRRSKGES